jgi:hypothetical protein
MEFPCHGGSTGGAQSGGGTTPGIGPGATGGGGASGGTVPPGGGRFGGTTPGIGPAAPKSPSNPGGYEPGEKDGPKAGKLSGSGNNVGGAGARATGAVSGTVRNAGTSTHEYGQRNGYGTTPGVPPPPDPCRKTGNGNGKNKVGCCCTPTGLDIAIVKQTQKDDSGSIGPQLSLTLSAKSEDVRGDLGQYPCTLVFEEYDFFDTAEEWKTPGTGETRPTSRPETQTSLPLGARQVMSHPGGRPMELEAKNYIKTDKPDPFNHDHFLPGDTLIAIRQLLADIGCGGGGGKAKTVSNDNYDIPTFPETGIRKVIGLKGHGNTWTRNLKVVLTLKAGRFCQGSIRKAYWLQMVVTLGATGELNYSPATLTPVD